MQTVQIDAHIILNMTLLELLQRMEESIDPVMTLTMSSRTEGKVLSGLILVRGGEETKDIMKAVQQAVCAWRPSDPRSVS